jgi:hypothetical protein
MGMLLPTLNIPYDSSHGPGVILMGELVPTVPELVGNSFVIDGKTVEVLSGYDGSTRITVTWPAAPPWSEGVKTAIAREVEPYILAFAARTGLHLAVEWSGASIVDASGAQHATGWTSLFVGGGGAPVAPLSTFASDAAVIASHSELRAALQRSRTAMSLLPDDPEAALSLAYLAVEGLVTQVRGGRGSRTSAKDWEAAAPDLAATRERLLRLYYSTQLGRHVNASDARQRLVKEGWIAWSAWECARVAAEVALSYLEAL